MYAPSQAAKTRLKPTSIGGFVLVLLSIALSAGAYGPLGESVRIRWTVGTHYHYGPEYAPTIAVLAAFPVILASLYVGFRWLESRLDGVDEFDDVRSLYDLSVLAAFGTLLLVQFALVVANVAL